MKKKAKKMLVIPFIAMMAMSGCAGMPDKDRALLEETRRAATDAKQEAAIAAEAAHNASQDAAWAAESANSASDNAEKAAAKATEAAEKANRIWLQGQDK